MRARSPVSNLYRSTVSQILFFDISTKLSFQVALSSPRFTSSPCRPQSVFPFAAVAVSRWCDVIIEQFFYLNITSYLIIVIQILSPAINTINISYIIMQVITQLDQQLTTYLPFYPQASAFAQNHLHSTLDTLNNIYTTSEARVNSVRKSTKGLRNRAVELCSQSADDLLDYIEEKLTIVSEEMSLKDKRQRVVAILNQLRQELFTVPLHRLSELNGALIQKTRAITAHYLLPLFITFKATVLVSREMMMEALADRLGQLKMTYKVSKDGVTMFFTGDFDEEKILARVGQNLTSFRQLTVNFVQKGMEISISKRDLFENYHTVVEKLSEIVRGVSSKGIEQWNDTKSKTMNLYHTVLNRIKEKEIQIKTEYVTKEHKVEPVLLPPSAGQKEEEEAVEVEN